MQAEDVGLLGARSFVGRHVALLLAAQGKTVRAVSRQPGSDATWLTPDDIASCPVNAWISVAPLWVTDAYQDQIEASGARRLVALSSTSRFTKLESSNVYDAEVASRLAQAEDSLAGWSERAGIELVVLRPTLIFGDGLDRNIAEIARVIRSLGFFPIMGEGKGLRQPIHAREVANAAILSLDPKIRSAFLNIPGGETLSYRDMVQRIFKAMGRRPLMPHLPRPALHSAIATLAYLPRFRHWTVSMADRMDIDMAFDAEPCQRVLGLKARRFHLAPSDIPA